MKPSRVLLFFVILVVILVSNFVDCTKKVSKASSSSGSAGINRRNNENRRPRPYRVIKGENFGAPGKQFHATLGDGSNLHPKDKIKQKARKETVTLVRGADYNKAGGRNNIAMGEYVRLDNQNPIRGKTNTQVQLNGDFKPGTKTSTSSLQAPEVFRDSGDRGHKVLKNAQITSSKLHQEISISSPRSPINSPPAMPGWSSPIDSPRRNNK